MKKRNSTVSSFAKLRKSIRTEVRYYRLLASDSETPRISKWLLAVALAYLVMPFDLIPDWIPLLGQLDDLIIIPATLWLALLLIPKGLRTRCRLKAKQTLSLTPEN